MRKPVKGSILLLVYLIPIILITVPSRPEVVLENFLAFSVLLLPILIKGLRLLLGPGHPCWRWLQGRYGRRPFWAYVSLFLALGFLLSGNALGYIRFPVSLMFLLISFRAYIGKALPPSDESRARLLRILPDRRYYKYGLYLLAGGLVAVALIGGFIQYRKEQALVSLYTSMSNRLGGEPQSEAYIRGKLIVVDGKKLLMDGIYRSLPRDMRAERPEEVETIILLDWEELLISGKPGFLFGDGRARFRRHCVVKIIDLTKMAEIHQTTFYGSEPYVRRLRGSSYGSWPTDDVENYIGNLPRK